MGVYQNQNQMPLGLILVRFIVPATPNGCTKTKLHGTAVVLSPTTVLSPTWFYARVLHVSKNSPPEATLAATMTIGTT
jgi:hypothetical protein